MIITKEVDVSINIRNIEHFRKSGYKCELSDSISVNAMHLSNGSHSLIICECENCNIQLEMEFRSYYKNKSKHNIFLCKKCSHIKNKMTFMKKYGVVNNSQLPSWKTKVQEKWSNKTNDELKIIDDKHKKHYMEKYGVEYYTQTDEYKEKAIATCIRKYGVINPSLVEEFKDQRRLTKIKVFGVENNSQLQEWKESVQEKWSNKTDVELKIIDDKHKKHYMEKYGVEYYTQTDECKEKIIATCIDKYGVTSHNKYTEIHNKQQKSAFKLHNYNNTNLTYQGTYELNFLDNYHGKLVIENATSVKYKLNESSHIYYPDFYLPEHNLIVEIKSTYTYELYLEKNLAKQKQCLENGYNFIFIIDKDYTEFNTLINI